MKLWDMEFYIHHGNYEIWSSTFTMGPFQSREKVMGASLSNKLPPISKDSQQLPPEDHGGFT
jgi:hypothetical protein